MPNLKVRIGEAADFGDDVRRQQVMKERRNSWTRTVIFDSVTVENRA
jgi:hypothetical protein